MADRMSIRREAVERVRALAFGDPVTNICAGDQNPMLHCYFVQLKGKFACCTDKVGHFWDIGIEVVYPGHLGKAERERLYAPVWEAEFGKPSPVTQPDSEMKA